MTFDFCTSQAAINKAGLNANASIIASCVAIDEYMDQVQSDICTITRYDWVANYASVGANFKNILSDTASDMFAMKIIVYDPSGYTSRAEAQFIVDVLKDNSTRNLEILKEQKNQEKMI